MSLTSFITATEGKKSSTQKKERFILYRPHENQIVDNTSLPKKYQE